MKSSLLKELLIITSSYSSYTPMRVRSSVSKYSPHYGKNAARRNRVQAELLKEKRQVREEVVRLKDDSVHLWASLSSAGGCAP